jgi:antitoxin ParD1/3/4
MATMNISLPDQMKKWVEDQTKDGRYANSSDVIRDLIRREQVRAEKIAHLQRLVDEAEASGVSERSLEEIFEHARNRARVHGFAEDEAGGIAMSPDEHLSYLRGLVEEAENSGVSQRTVMDIFAEAQAQHQRRSDAA